MVHLVPTTSTLDARGAALLYMNNVLVKHGLSKSIVSDRDPRFTQSAFLKELFTLLGTELKLSTATTLKPMVNGKNEQAGGRHTSRVRVALTGRLG